MKIYCGNEVIASRFGLFIPGEQPLVPLDRRQGGPHILSGRGGEKKIPSLGLPATEPRSSSP